MFLADDAVDAEGVGQAAAGVEKGRAQFDRGRGFSADFFLEIEMGDRSGRANRTAQRAGIFAIADARDEGRGKQPFQPGQGNRRLNWRSCKRSCSERDGIFNSGVEGCSINQI